MQLNRKGFTLVELLVVIVILLAIMLVALPNINSTLEKSKNKDSARIKELITQGALMYANDNGFTDSTEIMLSTLVNDGYLTKKEADSCGMDVIVKCNYLACDDFTCD